MPQCKVSQRRSKASRCSHNSNKKSWHRSSETMWSSPTENSNLDQKAHDECGRWPPPPWSVLPFHAVLTLLTLILRTLLRQTHFHQTSDFLISSLLSLAHPTPCLLSTPLDFYLDHRNLFPYRHVLIHIFINGLDLVGYPRARQLLKNRSLQHKQAHGYLCHRLITEGVQLVKKRTEHLLLNHEVEFGTPLAYVWRTSTVHCFLLFLSLFVSGSACAFVLALVLVCVLAFVSVW